MKIKATLGKKKVLAGQGHDAELLVKLLAPAPPSNVQRPALAIVPIVDVSGSMSGSKLQAVQRALMQLVGHLVPGDHVGLVTFDHEARVVLPVVEVTESSRARLRAAIQGLSADGNTNLAGGFLAGVGAVKDARLPERIRARLILLTDGQANVGVATTRPELGALVASQLATQSLSAFGYGDDCDHGLLAGLAEEGRGSFAYIANEDIVLTAFGRELGGLVATYAADVRIQVTPIAGAPIEASLGDLLFHADLPLSVAIALPRHEARAGVEVARICVTFRDASGRPQEASTAVHVEYVLPGSEDTTLDPEVARARDERLLRDAQARAEAHAERGDYAAARAVLVAVVAKLTHADLATFAREQLIPAHESHMEYIAASGMRASADVALKKRRMVAAQACVADALGLKGSAMEDSMEQSFRKGK